MGAILVSYGELDAQGKRKFRSCRDYGRPIDRRSSPEYPDWDRREILAFGQSGKERKEAIGVKRTNGGRGGPGRLPEIQSTSCRRAICRSRLAWGESESQSPQREDRCADTQTEFEASGGWKYTRRTGTPARLPDLDGQECQSYG